MKKYFFPFALVLCATSYNWAQENLSLEMAIVKGLESNFDVQIEKLQLEIDRRNNHWGNAGRYPTISFNGNQNNSIVQRVPANPFAVPGKNISDNLNGQLDVLLVLFDGFSVRLSKDRLERLEALSEGNATFVMETTLQSVILGYYQALLERERLQVLKENLAFSKERYDYVKLRKELGSAIPFDVLQEENNYLTDSTNVLLQEMEYKNSVRSLNLLLNEDIHKSYVFLDSLSFSDQVFNLEDLRERMERNNTNLKNQFINQEILKINRAAISGNRYPRLTFNTGLNGSLDWLNANFRILTGNQIENTVGYVNRDPGQPGFNTSDESIRKVTTLNGNSYGVYANFGLRWTIFNGGYVRRSLENAKVMEKMGQLSTEQLKNTLYLDLISLYEFYNLRRQLVSIASIKRKAAELNLNLANERYKIGSISAIDLRIIQENFLNAALENYGAIFAALSAKLELVRITGGLLDNYKDQQ